MKLYHWAMLAGILVIGYYLGGKYPGLLAKVGV